ncbi:MAG: hypothetical protein JW940_27710 [Polyangiaceae bacterium]|nr:hypothetical protein [Polyangiaceae bacterium]
MGRYFVAHDLRTRLACAATVVDGDPWFVCVIGYVVDPIHATDDSGAVAARLLGSLRTSEVRFFDELDELCGRFVVFYRSRGQTAILTDACATRSVFYSTAGPLVLASHFGLAQLHVSARSPRSFRRADGSLSRLGSGYPGLTTPDTNIAILTANALLRLDSRRVERFYPRAPLAPLRPDEGADRIADHFVRQLQVLQQRYRMMLSLTAGVDSRASLSVAHRYRDRLECFTYNTHPAHATDAALARDLTSRLGLPFRLLDIGAAARPELETFRQILAANSYHQHNPWLALECLRVMPSAAIHLRSNLFEIARCFWRNRCPTPEPATALDFARCYQRAMTPEDVDVVAAFEEFTWHTGLDQPQFGYDPYDLFYWEHRMSAWLSQVVIEADPAFDTYMLFNSRRCIEWSLGATLEERKNNTVLRRLITRQWPVLDRWPVNPRVFKSVPPKTMPCDDEKGARPATATEALERLKRAEELLQSARLASAHQEQVMLAHLHEVLADRHAESAAELRRVRDAHTAELRRVRDEHTAELRRVRGEHASGHSRASSDHAALVEQLTGKLAQRDRAIVLAKRDGAALQQRLRGVCELGNELLKQWHEQNVAARRAELARIGLQRQLTYQLGATLLGYLRSPLRWLLLPIGLWRAWRQFVRRRREAGERRPPATQVVSLAPGACLPVRRLLAAQGLTVRIDTSEGDVLRLGGSIQSFSKPSDCGVSLGVVARDAQDAIVPNTEPGFCGFAEPSEQGPVRLRSGWNASFSLELKMPRGAAAAELTFRCASVPPPVRLVLRTISCSPSSR